MLTKLNSTPVNKLAASMFWKTPEWAQVPETVKMGIIEARLPDEYINIDYYKPPPKRKGPSQITDRRGLRYLDKFGNNCLIVGYSTSRSKHFKTNKTISKNYLGNKPRKTEQRINRHFWWVLIPEKGIKSVSWEGITNNIKQYNK